MAASNDITGLVRQRTSVGDRAVIVASWQRSAEAGLHAATTPHFHRISAEELEERLEKNAVLINVSRRHLRALNTVLGDIKRVVYITDADGIVLDSIGDEQVKQQFGLTPGYDWSERRMGTNGAGTALICGEPVAVIGAEHFVSAFQACTCTAAPIRDTAGRIIAAVDITTGVSDGSIERVSLVAYVAEMVQRDLRNWEQSLETTELKRISEALRQREADLRMANERLCLLQDSVPCYIYVVDEGGRILNVNRCWQELTGLRLEQIIGASLYDLFDKETVQAFIQNNCHVLRHGQADFEERHNGRTYLSRKVPIKDHTGRNYAVCGFSIDVTERQAAIAELERNRLALAELDRRKDVFLAALSHELRNPLAPIKNGAEYLSRRFMDDEGVGRVCDVIQRNVTALVRLVDDLLDVSRAIHGRVDLQMAHTDLRWVVNEAVAAVHALIVARKQTITVTAPEQNVTVWADALRMIQVITNLIHNASKFTHEGGAIEVTLGFSDVNALLRVSDTGIGMSPDVLQTVFDAFAQAGKPGQKGGLGLGLFLARSLVELHGGSIDATSAGAGRGSEFTVRLPLSSQQ